MAGLQEMQIFNNGPQKGPDHTQVEVEGQSSYDRDREELARLGKKQVLKVCEQVVSLYQDIVLTQVIAELRLHVNARVFLYHHGDMGGHVGVRRDLEILRASGSSSDHYEDSSSPAFQS